MKDLGLDGHGKSLASIVHTLGPAVVRVVSTPGLDSAFVRDLAVHDPVDPPVTRPGDLLLAVGVKASSPEARGLVAAAGEGNAAAVVVKSPPDAELTAIRAAAEAAGITLLAVSTAMRWEQISVLIRHAMIAVHSSSLTSFGDLFDFANVLAKGIGGAVTLEGAGGHVLAYSTLREDELDPPRREAILGRQVPDPYLRHLRDEGVLDALKNSDEVIELRPHEGLGLRRRLAIAVRAESELLGTIWALEGKVPLGPDAERVLRDGARMAFAHLLRAQSTGFTLQQHREEMLRQLLEGSVDARAAADAIGFDSELPAAVIGIAIDARGKLPVDHHAYRRLDELLNVRAMAFRWQVSSVLAGVRMLALLPELNKERADELDRAVRRLGVGLSSDAEQTGLQVRVACGPVVPSLAHISRSTVRVDQTLQCLSHDPRRGSVATFDEVRPWVSVKTAVATLDPHTELWEGGPVARLAQYDAERGTDYAGTLRAWLDGFGDSAAVARDMNIHRNTLRYRMQRIVQLSGMRLDDPEERLMASLQLRRP